MELFDVILIALSTATTGFIAGYEIATRTRANLHYSQGKLDGINEVWPALTSAWADNLLLSSKLAANAAARGTDSN